MNLVIIGLGGALGAVLRYLSYAGAARMMGASFLWGTAFVNIAGSLAMGAAAALILERGGASPLFAGFLMTGVFGGFTTFSAFSLETAQLIETGRLGVAGAYVVGSIILSVAGLFLGLMIGRALS